MKVGYKRYTVIKYDCLDRRVNLIAACAATTFSLGVIAFVFTPLADKVGAALFWVLPGLHYFRQRSREKYMDGVAYFIQFVRSDFSCKIAS